jgi:hypothetical protein
MIHPFAKHHFINILQIVFKHLRKSLEKGDVYVSTISEIFLQKDILFHLNPYENPTWHDHFCAPVQQLFSWFV